MSTRRTIRKVPLGEDEVLKKVKQSSVPELWKFIRKITKGGKEITEVWCLECEAKFPYSGHPNYLRDHIRIYHWDYWIANCVKEPLTIKNENDDPPPPSDNNNVAAKQGILAFPKKVVIMDTFRQRILEALAIWISLDDQPFAAVEGQGFRHLLRTVLQGSWDDMPGSAAVKTKVTNLYGLVYNAVRKEVLKEALFPAVSIDKWTSPSQQGYIALVLHYVTSDWSYRQLLLALEEFPPPHSAENIAKWIAGVLREYQIETRPITMVTDGESALVSACKQLKYPRVYCTAHLISLIVGKLLEIPEVEVIYKKVKRLVKFFRQSNVAMFELQHICQVQEIPGKKLLQHSPTRWYGAYDMMERFLGMKAAISNFMELHGDLLEEKLGPHATFQAIDWGSLKAITQHLKGLKKAIKKLEAVDDASISVILPVVDRLYHKHCQQLATDSKVVKLMKEVERAQLQQRFSDYEYDGCVMTSPYLDPRFGASDFSVIQQANNNFTTCHISQTVAFKMLRQKLMNNVNNLPNYQIPEDIPEAEDDMMFDFEKKVKHSPFPSVEQELSSYLTVLHQANVHNSCLRFWKIYDKTFPLLVYEARRQLAVPAAAVGVERVWKGTKHIITDQ